MSKLHFMAPVENKGLLLIVLSLIAILLLDTFLIKFYDLLDKRIILIDYKKILFAISVALSILLQVILLLHVKGLVLREENNNRMNIKVMEKLFVLFLFIETFLFLIMIVQIFNNNYYDSSVLLLILTCSYIPSVLFLIQSIKLFISWLRMNKNITLFLYSMSLSFIIANLLVTNLIVGIGINDRPDHIRQFLGGTMDISSGKYSILADLLKITSILSFVSIWTITALVIQTTRSRRTILIKWILLLVPLVYFLVSYFSEDILYTLLSPIFQSDPINASLIFSAIFILSKPVGGLTFGLLYWRISTLVKHNKLLRQFMILAGIGFLLLYSSNQATLLVLTPFPPFGAVTISLLIPATFLIYIGIYRSAIIASTDSELRRYIYHTAKESKLLELISQSEMEKELNIVVSKVHIFVEDVNNINPPELDSNELRDYIEDVVSELRQEKLKSQES